MKQNFLIVLLTAAVVLLLVNLLLGRVPPAALGSKGGNSWVVCPGNPCIAIDSDGVAFLVGTKEGRKIGRISSFESIPEVEAKKRADRLWEKTFGKGSRG